MQICGGSSFLGSEIPVLVELPPPFKASVFARVQGLKAWQAAMVSTLASRPYKAIEENPHVGRAFRVEATRVQCWHVAADGAPKQADGQRSAVDYRSPTSSVEFAGGAPSHKPLCFGDLLQYQGLVLHTLDCKRGQCQARNELCHRGGVVKKG